MFYKNLNVFFPYYALVAYAFGSLLYAVLINVLSGTINIDKHHQLIGASAQAVIVLSLIFIWFKFGLAPTAKEGKESLSQKGHFFVAIGNFIIAIVAALLLLVGMTYGAFGNSVLFAIPFMGIAIISWVVGVIMIWMAANGS